MKERPIYKDFQKYYSTRACSDANPGWFASVVFEMKPVIRMVMMMIRWWWWIVRIHRTDTASSSFNSHYISLKLLTALVLKSLLIMDLLKRNYSRTVRSLYFWIYSMKRDNSRKLRCNAISISELFLRMIIPVCFPCAGQYYATMPSHFWCCLPSLNSMPILLVSNSDVDSSALACPSYSHVEPCSWIKQQKQSD